VHYTHSQHNKIIIFLTFIFISVSAFGQDENREIKGKRYPAIIVDGDTMPLIHLPPVIIYPQRKLTNDKASKEYITLARKVLKVYPYARLAVKILIEINDTISTMDKASAQRKYIKEYEKQLLAEYKTELVNMTVSEGRILIKLIDRETKRTSYKLIETLRGKSSAFFWQAIARLFGETLKAEYNPKGEDRLIEEIITKIEQGQLEPFPLPKRGKGNRN